MSVHDDTLLRKEIIIDFSLKIWEYSKYIKDVAFDSVVNLSTY